MNYMIWMEKISSEESSIETNNEIYHLEGGTKKGQTDR